METDYSKQITKLPKCAINNCNNNGFVYAFGKIICGECLVEMTNKINNYIFDKYKNEKRI